MVEYYGKIGGVFTFTTEDLNKAQYGNNNILGLYHKDTHNIEVKLTSTEILMQDDHMYSAPAHEFGHFLYDITKDAWTENMYKVLNEEFARKSKLNSACINIDETFAYVYAEYVVTPWKVNSALQKVIQKSLDVIKVRNGGGTDVWTEVRLAPTNSMPPVVGPDILIR